MKVAGSTSPLADDVIVLLMEVQRLKRLAKPNRSPKTRTKVRHINTTSRTVFIDERGGGYGSEYPNPNYGKVCPCKDCKESGGKRFTSQALIDKVEENVRLAEEGKRYAKAAWRDTRKSDYDGRLG